METEFRRFENGHGRYRRKDVYILDHFDFIDKTFTLQRAASYIERFTGNDESEELSRQESGIMFKCVFFLNSSYVSFQFRNSRGPTSTLWPNWIDVDGAGEPMDIEITSRRLQKDFAMVLVLSIDP